MPRPRVIGWSILLLCVPAIAGDWPGWRGNGAGVSDDGSYVSEWSATENVLWRTSIPGAGYSSPIVFGDRVFVTTAVESAQRRVAQWMCFAVVLILALAALALCAGTVMRHPFRAYHGVLPAARERPIANVVRQFVLAILFVTVLYFCLLILEQLGARVPGLDRRLGTGSTYQYGTRLFAGFPFSRYAWALGGCVACCVVLVVNRLLDIRAKLTPAVYERLQLQQRVLAITEGVLVLGAVGSFFGMLLANTGMLLLGPHNQQNTWEEITLISSIGAVAASGVTPRLSRWRLITACVGLLLMVALLSGPPDSPMRWILSRPSRGAMSVAYYSFTLVVLMWFGLQFMHSKRTEKLRTAEGSSVRGIGSIVLLALIAAQFVAAIVIVPNTALLRQLVCVNRKDGRVLWITTCSAGARGILSHLNTAASPTPATDGRHVYAHFSDASTFCVDFEGRVIWADVPEIVVAHEGAAISPVLWKDLIFVTHETDTLSFTVALDKQTGRERWRAERALPVYAGSRDSYSTPIVVNIAGEACLVHCADHYAVGYNPANGRALWSMPTSVAQPVASPVVANDVIILPAECHSGHRQQAIRIGALGQNLEAQLVWEVRGSVPGISSPVVYEGRLYSVTNGGIATCRDVHKGERLWRARLPYQYYASLTAADGKVFFCNLRGETTVLAADSEAHVLSTNRLGEDVRASFALSEGRIFIRGTEHLYCIGRKD